jgi:multidrug efflux pump subunit AcrA (membrane-fusion protein)
VLYWVSYEVYPAPSYWATDYLIAGYAADHYAASVSVAQAQEDARLAHEEADKARQAAEKAKDQAEIAEARQAQTQAELRAQQAENRVARAERQEAALGKPNPSVAPIDKETKEILRVQIEQTVAEKKLLADEAARGGTPVLPDLSKALADPKHIYPVARSISVISAADQKPAGTLTEGDLLRLEPGQEDILAHAGENTLVTMKVITSKGEDEEAKAGSLVSISLKSLQDFDSEFRAKLDLGLAEADKNQEQFKSGPLVSSN